MSLQQRTAAAPAKSVLPPAPAPATVGPSTDPGNAANQSWMPSASAAGSGLLGLFGSNPAEGTTAPPAAPVCAPTGFGDRAGAIFGSVDADGDGHMSSAEIDAAMTRTGDDALTGADAATVAMLRRFGGSLEELSNDEFLDENDGVTRADIERYVAAVCEAQANGTALPDDIAGVEGMFQHSTAQIAGASRDLFPTGAPDLAAIRQGNVGSCSFLSAVGSLVDQGRGDELVNMISTNSDGSYTVTFPGRDPVTVPAPTDAEIAYGATAGANGLWLNVLESAYGRSRDEDAVLATDGADGSLRDAITTLTGNSVNVDDMWATGTGTTHDRLTAAMGGGAVVTASIMSDGEQGLPGGHAYTVVGYDAATQTVTLRNPWGHTERTGEDGSVVDGTNDGTFTLTVEEFDDIYTDVAYEERPATATETPPAPVDAGVPAAGGT